MIFKENGRTGKGEDVSRGRHGRKVQACIAQSLEGGVGSVLLGDLEIFYAIGLGLPWGMSSQGTCGPLVGMQAKVLRSPEDPW